MGIVRIDIQFPIGSRSDRRNRRIWPIKNTSRSNSGCRRIVNYRRGRIIYLCGRILDLRRSIVDLRGRILDRGRRVLRGRILDRGRILNRRRRVLCRGILDLSGRISDQGSSIVDYGRRTIYSAAGHSDRIIQVNFYRLAVALSVGHARCRKTKNQTDQYKAKTKPQNCAKSPRLARQPPGQTGIKSFKKKNCV